VNDPRNPFPRTPAVLFDDVHDLMTVRTDAVNAGHAYTQGYLRAGRTRTREDLRAVGSGTCVAISGELGAGKSHLLAVLAADLAADLGADPGAGSPTFSPHVFSSGRSPGRFLTLYRDRLIAELEPQEFPKVVKFHLAAATAQVLTQLGAPEDLILEVREDSVAAAERARFYRLSDYDIRRAMRDELRRVTDSDNVAAHLSLLDLSEEPHAIWEWLSGKYPDQTLIERGIKDPIDDDTRAFDAFAMLTFLYGRAGEPFVLLIDEVEKLLQDDRDPSAWRTENLQALEKLVNVFIDTGGLAIFCVLPESLRRFSTGFHQRLRVLPLDPFTVEQAKGLIDQFLPEDSPVIFPHEVVKSLVELTNGNPRLILELCERSWHPTYRQGMRTEVEAATVREAIRSKFEVSRTTHVIGEVRQVLETGAWVPLPEGPDAFRMSGGPEGAAVTVIVTDSLLSNEHTQRITRRIDAILAMKGGQEVIVVVNGYLRPDDRQKIASMISRQPLTFDHHGFRERLREQMTDARRRLDDAGKEGMWESIRDEVLRVNVQQSYTHSMLERLAGSIGRAAAQPGGGASQGAAARLPEPVRLLFDRSLSALRALSGIDSLYDETFEPAPLFVPALHMQPDSSRELFQTVGIAVVLQRLVEAFRDAVTRWYDRAGQSERVGAEQVRELRTICQRYEINAEVFPLFRLIESGGGGAQPGLTDQVVASARGREALAALTDFGNKVEEELLTYVRSALP
jgi:hypothetical protein